jgi:NAD(P)-dependent dehydrogenase (short-subunit alcohol dehydrogenase family)
MLVGRDAAALEDAARSLGSTTEIVVQVADVSRSEDVEAYVAEALRRFGSIDILFNNAGIEGAIAPIAEYPIDEFDRVIAINLRGVFLGLRHVLPVMLAQGAGSIINTGSLASEVGLPASSAYIAAKHAVLGLTRAAAADLAGSGVRVNAVLPGMVDTQLLRSVLSQVAGGDLEGGMQFAARVAPQGRVAASEEIAEVVVFLASDAASFVTGVGWPVDGGALAVLGN